MRVGRLAAGLGFGAVFALSARAAMRPQISRREASVFRWFNDGSDAIATPVWVVTQAGSLGSVFVTAAAVQRRRGAPDALPVLAVGGAVWIGTKLVKSAIGRGRPDVYLDGVRLKGRPPSGLGYPSGHAAVATALALFTPRSRRGRLLSLVVASMVGSGRIYLGAHLPLDVAGGVALGAGAALTAEAIRTVTLCTP